MRKNDQSKWSASDREMAALVLRQMTPGVYYTDDQIDFMVREAHENLDVTPDRIRHGRLLLVKVGAVRKVDRAGRSNRNFPCSRYTRVRMVA